MTDLHFADESARLREVLTDSQICGLILELQAELEFRSTRKAITIDRLQPCPGSRVDEGHG